MTIHFSTFDQKITGLCVPSGHQETGRIDLRGFLFEISVQKLRIDELLRHEFLFRNKSKQFGHPKTKHSLL